MSEPATDQPAPPRPSAWCAAPPGKRVAIVKGQDYGRFTDFYHGILTVSWPLFFLRLLAAFHRRQSDLRHALCRPIRGGIANARPGSFADAFFFSVQTLGTLGYGVMAPQARFRPICW